MEALLTSLPVPIVVAVVTALVASLLSSQRARNDRLAALRLDTYRDLALVGRRWEAAFDHAAAAQQAEQDITVELEAWRAADNELREHMRLLPLVARKRAVDRIEEDFENLRETVKGMEKGRAEADFEGWSGTVRDRMRALVDGAVEEGRREVRRTRA